MNEAEGEHFCTPRNDILMQYLRLYTPAVYVNLLQGSSCSYVDLETMRHLDEEVGYACESYKGPELGIAASESLPATVKFSSSTWVGLSVLPPRPSITPLTAHHGIHPAHPLTGLASYCACITKTLRLSKLPLKAPPTPQNQYISTSPCVWSEPALDREAPPQHLGHG